MTLIIFFALEKKKFPYVRGNIFLLVFLFLYLHATV